MKTEFKETQKFTQWWLWIILIAVGILPIYGIYKQLFLGEPFGDKPMSDVGLIILLILIFLLLVLFYVMRLHTEINQYEIRMHFFPFIKKRIDWTAVKSTEVLDYGFVGGWGIRLWTKYGTVYNVKGTKGLAIELLNGKKLLIGTQKETELSKFIQNMKT